MFFIDNNNDLWVVGANATNKLGLTAEQRESYTERTPVKIELGNEKVSKVFSTANYYIK